MKYDKFYIILVPDDPILPFQLQWQVAQFLLNVRENGKTSQVTLEKITDFVVQLIGSHSSFLLVRRYVYIETRYHC